MRTESRYRAGISAHSQTVKLSVRIALVPDLTERKTTRCVLEGAQRLWFRARPSRPTNPNLDHNRRT
jgi:hypothetical protein